MRATIEAALYRPNGTEVADKFSPKNRRRVSGPAMRTFQAIGDLWRVSETERLRMLGLPSRSTYFGWLKSARDHRDFTLPLDALLRISALLSIHKGLTVKFSREQDGLQWLRTPEAAMPFGRKAPMNLITDGTQEGMILVRRFLDAARGGEASAPNAVDADFMPMTEIDLVFE